MPRQEDPWSLVSSQSAKSPSSKSSVRVYEKKERKKKKLGLRDG